MKDIVIIGAGGMGRETAWLIEQINQVEEKWNILGYLDDNENVLGKILNGYKVLGKIEILDNLPSETNVVIAIGNGKIREKIIERLGEREYPILIHPNVNIAKSSEIGEGTIICSGALISIETKCIDIKDELAKLKQQKTLIIMEIDSLSYEIEQLLNFGVYKQAKIYNIINQIEKLERKLIELDK